MDLNRRLSTQSDHSTVPRCKSASSYRLGQPHDFVASGRNWTTTLGQISSHCGRTTLNGGLEGLQVLKDERIWHPDRDRISREEQRHSLIVHQLASLINESTLGVNPLDGNKLACRFVDTIDHEVTKTITKPCGRKIDEIHSIAPDIKQQPTAPEVDCAILIHHCPDFAHSV